MANYNVGNIEIGIVSNSSKAINNLDAVISKLQEFSKIDKKIQETFNSINKLSNGLKKINQLDTSVLESKIASISQLTLGLTQNLNKIDQPNFEATAKSLNKVGNALRQFNNMQDFDFRKIYESFSQINRILTPFLVNLNASRESLMYLSNVLDKFKNFTSSINQANTAMKQFRKSTQAAKEESQNANKIFSKMFDIGKIYWLYNYTKGFTSLIGKAVTLASDYAEILNKYQMSFGDLTEENLAKTNKLADAFGISSNTLMDYTATFNNMLNGLKGLDTGTSAKLSQTLTQMAVDYSSLFNVSIDSSMKAFQSAIAGNIRSLRDISGYDVSETTVYSIYQQLGGTKSMRQLNQLEKRMLRIVAIQKQMEQTGALGDYGRTIDTVSNQVKILKEQLIEMGKWIGMNLLVYIKPIITYANAIVMTIARLAKEWAELKEKTDGIDYKKEFAAFSSSVEDTTEAVDTLTESLQTLALDKLNILGSSSSTSIADGLSVEGNILNALKEYKYNIDEISSKAKDISNRIYSWLITGDRIKNILKTIFGVFGSIIGLKIGAKIVDVFSNVKKIKTAIGGVNGIKGILSNLISPQGALTLMALAFFDLYTTNEKFRDGVNHLVDSFKNVIEKGLNPFQIKIEDISKLWDTLKGGIGDNLGAWADTLGDMLDTIDSIMDLAFGSKNGISIKLGKLADELKDFFDNNFYFLQLLRTKIKDTKDRIDSFGDIFGNLKLKASDFFNDIGRAFSELGRNISNGLKTFVNFFIKCINKLIDGLNKMHIEFPNWLPGIGGNSFGITLPLIPELTLTPPTDYDIPALAKGGVATTPTMAMIGEYTNAKSNPEIVAPQSILRETMMETMVSFVNAILQGNNEVVKAIENKDLNCYLDGRKVSESIYNDLNSVAIRKGKVMFATGK